MSTHTRGDVLLEGKTEMGSKKKTPKWEARRWERECGEGLGNTGGGCNKIAKGQKRKEGKEHAHPYFSLFFSFPFFRTMFILLNCFCLGRGADTDNVFKSGVFMSFFLKGTPSWGVLFFLAGSQLPCLSLVAWGSFGSVWGFYSRLKEDPLVFSFSVCRVLCNSHSSALEA